MHSVETNVGAFYSGRNYFPDGTDKDLFSRDAATTYVQILASGSMNVVDFVINSSGSTSPLYQLHGSTITATAATNASKIVGWTLSNGLATQLGLK
jgi:hypothetical protein